MKNPRRWLLAATLCAALPTLPALAQDPGPALRHAPGGIDYISGGAGEESRTAMATHAGELPLKIVLSGPQGEYVVADHVRFSTAKGEALIVRDAGPVLMLHLPPGAYTVEATALGKSQRHSVSVGSAAQTLNWRFPG